MLSPASGRDGIALTALGYVLRGLATRGTCSCGVGRRKGSRSLRSLFSERCLDSQTRRAGVRTVKQMDMSRPRVGLVVGAEGQKWNRRWRLWCLLVAVGLATTPAPTAAQRVPDDFVLKLERTECLGECPVYSVSIDAIGNVTYEGTKFVRVQGRQTDRIQVSRVAALLATAERIGFFDLRDRYRTIRNPDGTESFMTDLPTAYVTITRGGRSKRIEDYVDAPQALKQLEQLIDDTARTKRWI